MGGRRRTSKKQSAANFKWPDELVLFLDECLGAHTVADALRAAGARVEVHVDHFREGTEDTEWLTALGARGWVVLTKDRAMRRRAAELEALRAAGLRVFALTAAHLSGPATAEAFVRALRRIAGLCQARRPPFIAAVTASGLVSILEVNRVEPGAPE